MFLKFKELEGYLYFFLKFENWDFFKKIYVVFFVFMPLLTLFQLSVVYVLVNSIKSCIVVLGTLERILRCLSEAVLVYGEEVIDSQIFAFVFKQLDGITSQVSERSVASILAALHIMKLSVSLMTDPFLVKNLHKLNMVLVKVADIFLSPTSNLADNPDSRYVMASVWIKILTEICGRIGRDMILSSFMKTVLSFFTNLEDFLTRSAMPRQPLSYEFSPFKKGASSGESADFYTDVAIQQDSILFGTPKNYSNLMRSSVSRENIFKIYRIITVRIYNLVKSCLYLQNMRKSKNNFLKI